MLSALIATAALTFATPDDPAARAAGAAEAADILERAARAQNSDAIASDLRDFSVRLLLQRRENGSRVDLDVERKFKSPDLIWTRIVEEAISGTRIQQGYDGDSSWMFDEKAEETILYEGPEYRTDRKKIQTDLKTMRQLLRFFFLRNLIPALEDLERLDDASGHGLESMVVRGHGKLPETDDEECVVTLWVEKETDRLLGARLEVEGNVPMQFCFSHHAPNGQGVIVPGRTTVYQNDEESPSETLTIAGRTDEDGEFRNDIQFNTGIGDETFRPPSR